MMSNADKCMTVLIEETASTRHKHLYCTDSTFTVTTQEKGLGILTDS